VKFYYLIDVAGLEFRRSNEWHFY